MNKTGKNQSNGKHSETEDRLQQDENAQKNDFKELTLKRTSSETDLPTAKKRREYNDGNQKQHTEATEADEHPSISQLSQSPKKRLQLPSPTKQKKQKAVKEKFIYGNYSQYYGYRNKDFHDIRLDMLETRPEIFKNKTVLDIGCNNGFITSLVAKRLHVKSITGIDIDRSLINHAIKDLVKTKKTLPLDNELRRKQQYPYNVHYVHGNYVLQDDVLLEIERPQFDVILCLSITKWIQLNFGDAGLKQAFRRMFLQLHSSGHLILEAQPLKNYRKRKYVSDAARTNFETMKFVPEQFTAYLLSDEVGFNRVELLGVPEHCAEGFKRPIQIFSKD